MKKRIWFRMTDEDKSRLQEMASSSGRTVSGYIRAKLFGGEKATKQFSTDVSRYRPARAGSHFL